MRGQLATRHAKAAAQIPLCFFSVFTNSMFIPTKKSTLAAEFGGASTNVNSPVTNNYVELKFPSPQRSRLPRLRLKVMENSHKIIQKHRSPNLTISPLVARTRAMPPPVQPYSHYSLDRQTGTHSLLSQGRPRMHMLIW